jgi:serine/threonine-protein kinase
MEFRILGPLEVSGEDGALALGGAKQRAVLAHLVLRANHVVPADTLIDELWGEEPPETARNTVQTYVYRLRGILGQDRIEGRAPGYVLLAGDGEIDADRFEALSRDARADLVEDPAAALATLSEALALWRGPALADLHEEASLAGEIARLDELRLAALEDKISAELALGQHARIVGELEALTTQHPLRERLWGDLMLALYRSGRQAEALEAYQRARAVLADELGIDPSRRLQRLHEQVLAQDPALSAASRPIPVVIKPQTPPVPGELAAETKLAGYRIEDLLGRGGMSTVYLAEDTRLRRRVALKVLASELGADERFRERFVRESQVAAGMEHPNIVPIYEAGEAEGRLFIAMRYVRGTDLRRLIAREGRLDPERTVRILRDVASALDAAHAEGLVHRDVKPGNILLIEGAGEEGRDVVYLSDFGLTKRLEGQSGGLTQTGQFVGTVDYVAPEQIEGKPVDGRADVYSLGCVLYECLTGRVPFGREEQVAALYAHLQDAPPKLSAERSDLPAGLDGVLAKALAKSPVQRYPTCGELVAAARAELTPGSGEGASGVPIRRAGRGWLAAAAAAVVAAVLAVLALVQGGSPETAGQATGAAQQVLPSPSPTPRFRTVQRPLTAEDERLLTYIPKDVARDCAPLDVQTGQAVGALACKAGEVEVLYTLFETRDAMDAALQVNANVQGATGGECATDQVALTPYTIDGLPAGRVLCYRTKAAGAVVSSPGGARSDIEWTDERLLVYAHAVRGDAGDFSLYDWWLRSAGPVIPTAGPGAISKDLPAGVSRSPDGSYLLQLSNEDADRSGLSSISGIKGVVSGTTDWAGTWAFRIAEGEYELAHDGEPVEAGTIVLQKPDTIVFTPKAGQCLFFAAQPAGYRWSLGGPKITWELGEEGGCAGPQPLTGREWVRAPKGELAFASSRGDLITTDAAGLDRRTIEVSDLPPSAFHNQPVWAPDGSSLVFAGETDAGYDLYVVDPDGSDVRQVTDMGGNEYDPAWSPDGSKIAFHHNRGTFHNPRTSVHIVNADGSGLSTLVDMKGWSGRPAWSPDGSRIALQINGDVYVVDGDGSDLTRIYDGKNVRGLSLPQTNGLAWTPYGTRIVFAGGGPDGTTLLAMRPDGTDARPLIGRLPSSLMAPVLAFSPDGRWIVVTDDWGAGQVAPGHLHPAYLIRADGEHVYLIADDMFEPSWRPGRA